MGVTPHPAKFNAKVLEVMGSYLPPGALTLDPFGGTGGLSRIEHILAVCVEIEPEWATQVVADVFRLPFPDYVFDAVATSPVFGNRMSDSHVARDASRRYTYTHQLGRKLHPNNSGQIQWGRTYRAFHHWAWGEVIRTLKPGGLFLLNTSDHIRKGERQPVTDFHESLLADRGLTLLERIPVVTKRMRHGENHELRVDSESVSVFKKGSNA